MLSSFFTSNPKKRSSAKSRSSRHQVKPQIESLEAREVPAAYVDGWGNLVISQTHGNDSAYVTSNGSHHFVNDNGRWSTFSANSVRSNTVVYYGHNGNDWFRNYSGMRTVAYGHRGNDTLIGSSGNDHLFGQEDHDELQGQGGNDTLWGWYGNDRLFGQHGHDVLLGEQDNDTLWGYYGNDKLFGQEGHDVMYGEQDNDTLWGWYGNDKLFGQEGHDVMFGEQDNDTLWGWYGNDKLFGQEGDDVMWGEQGNDTLWGWYGNDTLFGQEGHDLLLGEQDNDLLYGWTGNDTLDGGWGDDNLYGEGGSDRLYGGDGNDGLFGGADRDTLTGGAGADRYLDYTWMERKWYQVRAHRKWQDHITDANWSYEARIGFENSGPQTVNLSGFGATSFAAGNWTDHEAQNIDVALGNLHRHVGNTRLLETAGGGGIIFQRIGNQLTGSGTIGGWNTGDVIAFTNRAFSSNLNLWRVVYHEIGHNWDEPGENRYVTAFRQISDWRQSAAQPTTIHIASDAAGDNWWFVGNDFARTYGMWNPYEDYATTFETYFLSAYHGTTMGNNIVLTKFNNLNRLFHDLRWGLS